MVAAKEPTLKAIVLLAGIARPGMGTLKYQMTNLLQHDSSLTAARRDSAIAAIPARIDTMMARDPWMRYFLLYDPSETARRVSTPVLILRLSRQTHEAPGAGTDSSGRGRDCRGLAGQPPSMTPAALGLSAGLGSRTPTTLALHAGR